MGQCRSFFGQPKSIRLVDTDSDLSSVEHSRSCLGIYYALDERDRAVNVIGQEA